MRDGQRSRSSRRAATEPSTRCPRETPCRYSPATSCSLSPRRPGFQRRYHEQCRIEQSGYRSDEPGRPGGRDTAPHCCGESLVMLGTAPVWRDVVAQAHVACRDPKTTKGLRGCCPQRPMRPEFHWLPSPRAFPAWLSVTRRRCSPSPTSPGCSTKSPPTCGSCAPCCRRAENSCG